MAWVVDNLKLKRELPRIPFAPDFKAFAEAGKKLATLHLDYEKQKEWDLAFDETPGVPLSYRVEKMKLVRPKVDRSTQDAPSPQPSPGGRGARRASDDIKLVVNESLTLSGIPPEAFEYRLGNRSALDWVIDQYQVSKDKRSGITIRPEPRG